MLKKIFSLLLLSLFLIGCTNKIEEDVAATPNAPAMNPSSSITKTYSTKDISLLNKF